MIFASVVALLIGFTISQLLQKRPYDPFPSYDIQTVIEPRSDGVPILDLSKRPIVVTVRGTRCNSEDRKVQAFGDLHWQSVDPPGITFLGGEFASLRDPGCTTALFENVVPHEVVHQMRTALIGRTRVTWRIRGADQPTETPDQSLLGINLGPRPAAMSYWTTENFDVVRSLDDVGPVTEPRTAQEKDPND